MLVSNPKDIGMLIRAKRSERSWTQGELARHVGTTQRWISEIENGKATAEIGMVLRTLSMLGIRLEVGGPSPENVHRDTMVYRDMPTIEDLDDIVDGPAFRP
jgi:y4mF family transcriptional regulator